MAQEQHETLINIRQFAAKARELQEGQMDVDASGTEARLDETIKELQARVKEQQAALERVRPFLYPSKFMLTSPSYGHHRIAMSIKLHMPLQILLRD